MSRVDTDWFAFVDTDVRLRPNWWIDVQRNVHPDVGGIEGLWSYKQRDPTVENYSQSMVELSRLLKRRSWIERIDRGFTGDTLIRTKAVSGISIPTALDSYEDEFIRRYVVKSGYRWVRTAGVVCDHLRRYNLQEAYDSGKYALYFGQTTMSRQLRRFPLIPLKVLYALWRTSDFTIMPFILKREVLVFKGVVQAHSSSQDLLNSIREVQK